jgi:hypothetical protein
MVGFGGSASGFLQVTDADSVDSLKGESVQVGGSAGEALVIGGDYIVGYDKNCKPTYKGGDISVGVGAGSPIEGHAFRTFSGGFVGGQK